MANKPGKTDSFVTEITPRSQDFSRWYLDVVRKAEEYLHSGHGARHDEHPGRGGPDLAPAQPSEAPGHHGEGGAGGDDGHPIRCGEVPVGGDAHDRADVTRGENRVNLVAGLPQKKLQRGRNRDLGNEQTKVFNTAPRSLPDGHAVCGGGRFKAHGKKDDQEKDRGFGENVT